jgi:hypothetical protein
MTAISRLKIVRKKHELLNGGCFKSKPVLWYFLNEFVAIPTSNQTILSPAQFFCICFLTEQKQF